MKPWGFQRLVCEARGLDRTEKLVLFTMLRWVNESGVLWPSVQTIADAASLGRRACGKTLLRLEERGVLQKLSGGKGGINSSGRGISTTWRINAEELEVLAKPSTNDQTDTSDCHEADSPTPRSKCAPEG